jgi:hypothetical protein
MKYGGRMKIATFLLILAIEGIILAYTNPLVYAFELLPEYLQLVKIFV